MKPFFSGARTSVVRWGLGLVPKMFGRPIATEQTEPIILPEPDAHVLAWQDERRKEAQQTVKQEAAASLSRALNFTR